MNIRQLDEADGPGMLDFARCLPPAETTFFREEEILTNRVSDWALRKGTLRLVAVDGSDGSILGYAAVAPRTGHSAHVGEISLIVAPDQRGRGVGKKLAHEAMLRSFQVLQLSKLVVEILATQEKTAAMFEAMGFRPEALLVDHLRDAEGRKHDLLMLCHHVDDSWSEIATIGLDTALYQD